ncbi:MAG TPA: deoxyribodipyrimidine photo-lyase, partial [Thermomonas sp.]|nr:deoxyribodipyrimidine photo-lyase [Thermomonas sp.]
MSDPRGLLWFRNDLRLADNPALEGLLRAGLAPIPVYIHAPEEAGEWAPGAASDAWRARSLHALDADLRARGSRLQVLRGPTRQVLARLVAETGAKAVYWNRRYEPAIEARDADIKRALRADGIDASSHNGALVFEPWQVQSLSGDPYKVFTPFWRSALKQWRLPAALDAPPSLPQPPSLEGAVGIDALGLAPTLPWDRGFWSEWTPGEAGAHATLERFATEALEGYGGNRDIPSLRGTSRMSPHLHFGEIAPWRIARRLQDALPASDREGYLRELGWREFAHHMLHHFPHTPAANFNPRFDEFAWASPTDAQLQAWRCGRTGVPIVDAGMRELWATGWMHNRVRMIVGSFLTKHLRAHWRHGADWFWDTLVDA